MKPESELLLASFKRARRSFRNGAAYRRFVSGVVLNRRDRGIHKNSSVWGCSVCNGVLKNYRQSFRSEFGGFGGCGRKLNDGGKNRAYCHSEVLAKNEGGFVVESEFAHGASPVVVVGGAL